MEVPDQLDILDTQLEIKVEKDTDDCCSRVDKQTNAGFENLETYGLTNICNNDTNFNGVAGHSSVNHKTPSKCQWSLDKTGKTPRAKGKCFRCDICNKSFSKLSVINRHMRFHGEKSNSCVVCGRSYILLSDLKRHQRVHTGEKPYKCEFCHSQFTFSNSLIIHMRRHTGYRPYKSTFCGKSFSRGDSLKKHYLKHSGVKSHTCGECGATFTTHDSLKYHNQHEHANQSVKRHKCEICEKRFSKLSILTVHMRIHSGDKPYECGSCGVSFTCLNYLKRHLRTHTGVKPYTCLKCKQSFTYAGMQYHKLHVHKETNTETEKPNVKQCDPAVAFKIEIKGMLKSQQQFDKQKDIVKKKHVYAPRVIQMPQAIRYKYSLGSNKSNRFSCVICNKTFGKLRNLRRHMFYHTEKGYACDTCGRSFSSSTYLRNHKRIHSGEKLYKCDFCGKSFTLPTTLWSHKRSHTGDKPYKCTFCGKSFSRRSSLKRHSLTHTGVKQLDNTTACMEHSFARNNEVAEMRIESIEKAHETKKQNVSASGIMPSPNINRYISSKETTNETEDPKVKLCDQAVGNKVIFNGLILVSKQFDKESKSMEQGSTLKTDIAETSIKAIDQVDESKNSSTQCLLEQREMFKSLSSVTKFCNLDARRRTALSARNKRNENV